MRDEARRFGVLMLMFGLGGGCAAPDRSAEVATHAFAVAEPAQRQALWDAAESVLREHLFELSVVDRRGGQIVTRPETSQHFFEFWRRDVATAHDFLESSLRTVRRYVVVQFTPDAGSGETQLAVTVNREILTTPERQFNSSVAGFQFFNNQLPRADTGGRILPRDTYWTDGGRDPAMEAYLLGKIIDRWGGA